MISDKLYIAITGRSNTGKSSLTNLILGQEKAIVSGIAGTTTDPVKKNYEIPGFASSVFIDTAGIDDTSELGQQRISKTFEAIQQADAAILVITDNLFGNHEEELIDKFNNYKIPFIIVHNKEDLVTLKPELKKQLEQKYGVPVVSFSIEKNKSDTLLEYIKKITGRPAVESLIGDIIHPGDIIMLVTPIDSEAPTGRIILPQVQLIRDILDNQCINIVLQPEEIEGFLNKTGITPRLVITDSQVFSQVAAIIPGRIPLTGFSIVLARHKGNFDLYVKGTSHIKKLSDGNRILMLESCSHHVSCEDIGHNKIPALLQKYSGKKLEFDFIAGLDKIKRPITDYSMIIQCGGCMVTSRQLKNRLKPVVEAKIPISNYGMVIAYIQGIFERAIAPFT